MAEIINPPSYYFSGINFNPTFYGSANDSLTQTEANALYLQKTRPDTATALETFSAGINTLSVSSTGSGESNILNIGIQPRTVSGAVHHYSDGDNCVAGAGVHINNGINNGSATNISNGSNTTGNVNILSGSSSSGTIVLGTTATTTNLNGTSKIYNPIQIGYTSGDYAVPTSGLASLNVIGGNVRTNYQNTFTTSGTTKQVYVFVNDVPLGRYYFCTNMSMAPTIASQRITQRMVYSTNGSALTLNKSTNLTDYDSYGAGTADSINEVYATKPNATDRFSTNCSGIIDIITGRQNIGMAVTFGQVNVGTAGGFSLYFWMNLQRLS